MAIDNPEKIGLGTWDKDALGTALNDVDRVGFDWHYNCQSASCGTQTPPLRHRPMWQ
jgi:hypothetical protein